MCRIRQRGWSALPDREGRATEDDGPRGVSVGPARTVDSSRGRRPAEDTGAVRRNPGLPPPLHGEVNAVLHWWRWGFPLRCWSPSQHSRVSQRALGVLLPSHASLIASPLPYPPPRLQGREGRASRSGVVPPGQVWLLCCILRSTSSRLKLAAFWRCGYSLNVCRNSPTKACAGTSRNT